MPIHKASSWLLIAAALLAGVLGADAVWVVLAVWTGKPCSWMACVAALDVALMLRMAGAGPGGGRMLAAVLATALAIVLAQWLIVATHMGISLGLEPVDSALRLGPVLARELLVLSLGPGDLAWLLASLPLAAFFASGTRKEREAQRA